MDNNNQPLSKIDASNTTNVKLNDTELKATELNEAQQTRRDFMTKYGKLAAVTPVALTALMSPKTSAAPKSCKPQQGNKHCDGTAGFTGFE